MTDDTHLLGPNVPRFPHRVVYVVGGDVRSGDQFGDAGVILADLFEELEVAFQALAETAEMNVPDFLRVGMDDIRETAAPTVVVLCPTASVLVNRPTFATGAKSIGGEPDAHSNGVRFAAM